MFTIIITCLLEMQLFKIIFCLLLFIREKNFYTNWNSKIKATVICDYSLIYYDQSNILTQKFIYNKCPSPDGSGSLCRPSFGRQSYNGQQDKAPKKLYPAINYYAYIYSNSLSTTYTVLDNNPDKRQKWHWLATVHLQDTNLLFCLNPLRKLPKEPSLTRN